LQKLLAQAGQVLYKANVYSAHLEAAVIEMMVKGLAVDSNSRQPVVILTDPQEKRFLPIWIGFSEADAILLALEKIPVPRPGTHDLLVNLIKTLGASLDRVVVHDIRENTFFAHLHLLVQGDLEPIMIDARPSDGIALALRLGTPLFVSEAVLGQAAIMDRGKYEQEMEEFKKFIEHVTPTDFARYDEGGKGGSDKGPGPLPND
jgi:bifunctional DNase/RNase